MLAERKRLLSGKRPWAYISYCCGLAGAWLLTGVGAALSLDISAAPDLASDQLSNYFFQSFLILLALHLLEQNFTDWRKRNQEQVFAKLLDASLFFFTALASALAAINLTVWLLYQETHFLYCIMNSVLCLSYAYYRLQKHDTAASLTANVTDNAKSMTNIGMPTSNFTPAENSSVRGIALGDPSELPAFKQDAQGQSNNELSALDVSDIDDIELPPPNFGEHEKKHNQ